MTEAEWLRSADLSKLLDFLDGEVSDSKLRLFACSCCRRVWDLLDDLHRRTVEFVEEFARGAGRDILWLGSGNWQCRWLSCPPEQIEKVQGWAAISSELRAEQTALDEDDGGIFRYDNCNPLDTAASLLHFCFAMPYYLARGAAVLRTAPSAYWQDKRAPVLTDEQEQQWCGQIESEMARQCNLFRDIFRNPFRPVPINSGWLTPTVNALAQAASEDRLLPSGHLDPARLAVLGDALEETGCVSEAILEHCRSPRPHVRGCWVLDTLLGQ